MNIKTNSFKLTIVEVCVVCGIFLSLAAVLHPVLASANTGSDQPGSMASGRQIALANSIYSADFDTMSFIGCVTEDSGFATEGSGCMDLTTGRTWTDSVYGGHWDVSKGKCDNLVMDGFSDWRLPTIGELQTVYANGAVGHLQLVEGNYHLFHWSSNKVKANAWALRFDTGESGLFGIKPGGGNGWWSLYAMCVR